MKRTAFFVLFALLLLSPLMAGSAFVTARIAPAFAEASAAAQRVGVLRQGAELVVLEAGDAWTKVEITGGKIGFVQNLFIGDSPSQERVGRADSMQNVSSVVTRRRASAYTTSAAATRGLASENVRERENLSFKDYNFDTITWIERFTYSDDDIIAFATRERIGL